MFTLLFNRLENMPGPSVFVSPVAEAQFADDITVTYRVPDSVLVPADSLVSLIVWNPGRKHNESEIRLLPVSIWMSL